MIVHVWKILLFIIVIEKQFILVSEEIWYFYDYSKVTPPRTGRSHLKDSWIGLNHSICLAKGLFVFWIRDFFLPNPIFHDLKFFSGESIFFPHHFLFISKPVAAAGIANHNFQLTFHCTKSLYFETIYIFSKIVLKLTGPTEARPLLFWSI